MNNEYFPRYSGPNRSGKCKCGHSWEQHHLGMVMNEDYLDATREAYVPQECEAYGFNETGGMKYDKETKEWSEHCGGYVDELDMTMDEALEILHRGMFK